MVGACGGCVWWVRVVRGGFVHSISRFADGVCVYDLIGCESGCRREAVPIYVDIIYTIDGDGSGHS